MRHLVRFACAGAGNGEYVALLRHAGYQVTTLSDDFPAPFLPAGSERTDLVIVDCGKKGADIDEFLWRGMRSLPGVPFLLITDCSSVEIYVRSLALGVHEHLCRPLQAEDVVQAVGRLLQDVGADGGRVEGRMEIHGS